MKLHTVRIIHGPIIPGCDCNPNLRQPYRSFYKFCRENFLLWGSGREFASQLEGTMGTQKVVFAKSEDFILPPPVHLGGKTEPGSSSSSEKECKTVDDMLRARGFESVGGEQALLEINSAEEEGKGGGFRGQGVVQGGASSSSFPKDAAAAETMASRLPFDLLFTSPPFYDGSGVVREMYGSFFLRRERGGARSSSITVLFQVFTS